MKHDVTNDIVIASYVCLVTDTEHCMQGGDSGASFAANTQIIKDFQTFYNLPNGGNPGCSFASSYSYCDGGSFYNVYAGSNGYVYVSTSSSGHCSVYYDGNSYCRG